MQPEKTQRYLKMLLTNKTLNELQYILKKNGIGIEDRAKLDAAGIKIAKFVLAKELQKNA